jgi:hypothetical protein
VAAEVWGFGEICGGGEGKIRRLVKNLSVIRVLRLVSNDSAFSIVARGLLCLITGFVWSFNIGFQGNGTAILSGFFLGMVLGLGASGMLLFGVSPFIGDFQPKAQLALWCSSLIATTAFLATGFWTMNG